MLPMGRGNTRMPSEGNSVQGQAGKGVGKGGKNGSKNGNLTPAGRLQKKTTKNCGAVGVVDASFAFLLLLSLSDPSSWFSVLDRSL